MGAGNSVPLLSRPMWRCDRLRQDRHSIIPPHLRRMTVSETKPEAFILTGAFWVVCRNPLYLTELVDRDLKILVLTAAMWRDQALTCMEDDSHPAAAIEDIAFVDGDLSVESSFTAGTIAAAQAW